MNLLKLLVHEVAQRPVLSAMLLKNVFVADEARPVVVLFDFFHVSIGKI